MAKLLFSTDAFRSNGRAVPGVPILLDQNMRLVEPACSWLLHVALVRGRTRSKQTWRTYGEVLYDWWQTLEANRWTWDRVGPLELAAYRDSMLGQPSCLTGRPFARSTINLRLRTLTLFYSWCLEHGWIRTGPLLPHVQVRGARRGSPVLAHLDARGGRGCASDLTVRHTPRLPQPLGRATLRELLRDQPSRDRLIIEWSLLTGMRRAEVAALTLSAALGRSEEPLVRVRLDTTKGGKRRHVYPPLPLVDRTRAYAREERAVSVARARRRAKDYVEPQELFISKDGKVLSAKCIGAMFARRAAKAGVSASFHALRHTFACTMLRALQQQARANADINPLLTLQTLLGHADLSTTGIYVRAIGIDLEAVERSVEDLYDAIST